MRILLINYEYPPLGGGAGNATHHIAREMAACGHTVFVMTSRFRDLPHEETIDDYTVIRIPTIRKRIDRSNPLEMLIFVFSSLWQVSILRNRIKPDFSIAFFGLPSAPAAWLLKVRAGVPYIISLRGGDVPGSQDELHLFHMLALPLIRFLWWHASEVVPNSEGLRRLAQRTTPDRQFKVIPNGVDTFQFTPSPHFPERKFMFAGRFSAEKGLFSLIDAIAGLPSVEIARLQLRLVGDGPIRKGLQAYAAQRKVLHCLEFAGWVERSQIVEHYQSSSCFVLPSLYEGMPNVVLEAMSCGLPIIVTNVPGSQNLVDGNGWLLPPGNTASLTTALHEALSNQEQLQQMGRRSREIAETYRWQNTAAAYMDLIEHHVKQR